MKIHLLFEQSGTFKNEFIKLGYTAFDYDLQNQFNQTDYVIDLFKEIEKAYLNEKSIFDNFNIEDLIFAFFPCTYFSTQNNLIYSGKANQMKNMDEIKKNKYIKERIISRNYNLDILKKLIEVCKDRKLKLIIENPYQNNFLLSLKEFENPDLIIQDRTKFGDYYIKPTMFYFINLEPTFFSIDFVIQNNKLNKGITNINCKIKRSLMHPTFAYNFIQKYILGI